MTNEALPPARRRTPLIGAVAAVLVAALLLRVATATIGHPSSSVSGSQLRDLVVGIAFAAVLGACLLWGFYRPGRRLASEVARYGARPLMIYSSDRLSQALNGLTGVSLASSSSSQGAFLALIDEGETFALWRWYWSRPQCVARIPWARIDSLRVDEVAHRVTVDRAISLRLTANGNHLDIPVSPQECRRLRLKPVSDADFRVTLDLFRRRLSESRGPDAI